MSTDTTILFTEHPGNVCKQYLDTESKLDSLQWQLIHGVRRKILPKSWNASCGILTSGQHFPYHPDSW